MLTASETAVSVITTCKTAACPHVCILPTVWVLCWCSRAQTLHTFLQPSQASPDPGQLHSSSTQLPQSASKELTAGNAAVSAVAGGFLAGGAVRRRGANRSCNLDVFQWHGRLTVLVICTALPYLPVTVLNVVPHQAGCWMPDVETEPAVSTGELLSLWH